MNNSDSTVYAANHGKGSCRVCKRDDVLLYSRDGDATVRLTYHDDTAGVRCEGGGHPAATGGEP